MYGRSTLLSGHVWRTAVDDFSCVVRPRLNFSEAGTIFIDLIAIEQADFASV
jgi:hypothetical protein